MATYTTRDNGVLSLASMSREALEKEFNSLTVENKLFVAAVSQALAVAVHGESAAYKAEALNAIFTLFETGLKIRFITLSRKRLGDEFYNRYISLLKTDFSSYALRVDNYLASLRNTTVIKP